MQGKLSLLDRKWTTKGGKAAYDRTTSDDVLRVSAMPVGQVYNGHVTDRQEA